MSRRASVCAVELCGKWGSFLLWGFSQAFSCFLPVSIINIPVHILLWLSMSKQTDPHGSAEPFSPAVLRINTGHWMVDWTVAQATLLRRQAGVAEWFLQALISSFQPSKEDFHLIILVCPSPVASFCCSHCSFQTLLWTLIFWHFSCPRCVFSPPKKYLKWREIHTMPHY